MVDIKLTCRLFRNIEANSEKFNIDINTSKTVDSLKKKIFEEVQKKNDKIFSDIKGSNLELWMVQIRDDEFSKLSLENDGTEGIKELEEKISDYWNDENLPEEGFTNVIIDSPLLTALKRLEQYEGVSDYIIPNIHRAGFQDLYYAKIIRINDVLQIDKKYFGTKVFIQCKVVDFDTGILSVMLIDRNEEQKEGIFLLEDLERWLLEHSLDAKDRRSIKYENSGDNIEIIRNGVWLGTIRERKNYYFNNQELKKRHKDSAVKSELKQGENLSEEFNRLDKTEKNQSIATWIDDQEILSIADDANFSRLEALSDKLLSTYRKDTPSLSYITSGMVNEKPAIIAYVNVSKGTLVEIPAEFEGYPVFIKYGIIEPACYTSPVALTPGISISSANVCTLGALFKIENEAETGKTFILAVKHGVGNIDDEVIQPGSADAENGYTVCAKVTKYNFYNVIYEDNEYGRDAILLDYAFCEIVISGKVSTSNTSIHCKICIDNTKDSVNDCYKKYGVCKVGRTTNYTEGSVRDRLQCIFYREFGDVKVLLVKSDKSHEDSKIFGAPGDSGSPVFDKHNKLWGILQGISSDGFTATVIPIHLILHVKRRFGVSFKLLNE